MPFLNRVQQLVTTTGTGASITLGSVYAANAATMANAGAVNGAKYSYVLTEGNNFEVQIQQTYNSGAGTLTRGTPAFSLVAGSYGTTQITLLGGAVMAVELLAEDLATFLSTAGGTLTGALNWAPAVTVASSTTPAIGAAASNLITMSGTTTVTGFDTIAAGAERAIVHTGAHLLTHNATSLILLGGANITTAAGDVSRWKSEGSGNWRMLSYQRAADIPNVKSDVTRPANAQTGTTYTFVAADAKTPVTFNNASAITATINTGVCAAGDQIDILTIGAGKPTLVAGSGFTLNSAGGNKSISPQYAGATLYFLSSTSAVLVGSLAA